MKMKFETKLCKYSVGSLSGAMPDGKIPRDVFVLLLAGSLCNM